jgi:hypothetical protein
MNQRRAVSILVLLGSILFVVVNWNAPDPDGNPYTPPSQR